MVLKPRNCLFMLAGPHDLACNETVIKISAEKTMLSINLATVLLYGC